MKTTALFLLFLVFTVACIFLPAHFVSVSNTPKQIDIGLNQTYYWASDHILTLDGTYSLKSLYYFELHQGDVTVQAILEAPEPGESNGMYWIRNYPMTGNWDVSGGSPIIFSSQDSLITSTPDGWGKGWHIFSGSVLGFIAWLFSILFLTKLGNDLPD